jgi:hypothetical protein
MIATPVVQPPPNPAGALMMLGLIVGAIRRKHAIGGWLFFFFWQVVAGCAVTLAYTDWSQYAPRAWHDPMKYLLFMASAGPRIVVLPALALLGAILIGTQEWRWLVALRFTLILYAVLGLACIVVDRFYFPERLALDVGALVFPVVYCIYFFVSMRVRGVFLEHVWPA